MRIIQAVKNSALVSDLTPRLCLMYGFLSIGAINFGLDNGYWAALISVPQFARDRGVCNAKGVCSFPSSWLSAGTGTPTAGLIIGCVIAGPIIERLGRKHTVGVIISVALVGIIIQNAAPNYWVIMAGRFINSISMGIEANNIPLYMSELAPPAVRGSMTNLYQWWLFIGSLIGKVLVYKANDSWPTSEWSWRAVLLLQVFVPILLVGVFFVIPESPTWLLARDREEDARASLRFIRKGAASNEEIEQELQLTKQAALEQKELHKASTYADCFRGTNRRRTVIAIMVQVLEQCGGTAFMTNYRTLFLAQVGVTDPLLANVATICMGLAGSTCAFVLSDLLGRRPLMITASIIMWACLWTTCGVSAYIPGGVGPGPLAQGLLTLILIWSFSNTCGWGSCVWIVTAEVPTAQVREKTMSIATGCSFTAVLLVSYISPFVQFEPGYLGSKIGFIWGSVSLFAAFWVYFYLPELSQRSLQELDELFEAKLPARKFRKYKAYGIGATITRVQDANANTHEHFIEGKIAGLSASEDMEADISVKSAEEVAVKSVTEKQD